MVWKFETQDLLHKLHKLFFDANLQTSE